MNNPKTIKLFLIDGDPTGSKTIEISNWTGKAYIIPRNRLEETIKNPLNVKELNSQCVYFLIGQDKSTKDTVYVGEAENFIKRIVQHNRNKEFWNTAICFFAKDDNLTKAHVKYLEYALANKIKDAGRVDLDNTTNPAITRLPRSDESEIEEFMQNIEIILSSLGMTFTNKLMRNINDELFYCKNERSSAVGKIINEGFVIFKDSKISLIETKSLNDGISITRYQDSTSSDPYLVKKDESFVLSNDRVLSSPSYAAAYVLGRNANGWTEWKNKDGKTLDEVKRK